MNLVDDAKEFKRLCIKYREHDKDPASLAKIKTLVDETAERIARNFKVKMNMRSTGISKGRGIPLFAQSIPRMICRRGHVQKRDITTLDVRRQVGYTGVNILLDYSGSMWFTESDRSGCTIDGLQRIYAQNFYVLCLGKYLQKISGSKFYIQYTSVGDYPVDILSCIDLDKADIDGLLVHKSWGSEEYQVDVLESVEHDYFNREHPVEAFRYSYKKLKDKRFQNFISLFCTDGGIHRLGESESDRKKFLTDVLTTIQTDNMVLFFTFIKTQSSTFINMLKEHGQPHSEILNEEQYNSGYDYFASYMNTVIRGGLQ